MSSFWSNVKIPGVAWVALVMLLATWVGTYVEAEWAGALVIILGTVAKLIEMFVISQRVKSEASKVDRSTKPKTQAAMANAAVGRSATYKPWLDFFLG